MFSNKIKKLVIIYTPNNIKNIIKFFLNDIRNFFDLLKKPFDLIDDYNFKKKWLPKDKIQEYRKKIKVYDVFTFFNELELLEIRLNILDKYVDYFVIVEATETFSGLKKNLIYDENKHLFKKWENKIIHYVTTDTPTNEEELKKRLEKENLSEGEKDVIKETLESDNIPKGQVHWLKEFYQKESIKKALIGLNDDDACFVSDVDEIWDPRIIVDYKQENIIKYKQDPYIYYLNNRSNDNWKDWTGPILTKYKNIKNNCLNHLRTHGKNKYHIIKGGWHFTFQGEEDKIIKKLEAYGHQEINNSKIKSGIGNNLKFNQDIRGRHIKFWKDETLLPKYILDNKQKYIKLFK